MDWLREYVISVAAAAIIVGILMNLTSGKDTSGVLLRLIAGLFLAFTVIRPIAGLDIGNIGTYFTALSEDGTAAVTEGENLARDAYCSYIKSQTEAYILDKAEGYGAELTVEVYLNEGDKVVPAGVRLRGNVSPYGKACLQNMMEEELGILKENQLWIG